MPGQQPDEPTGQPPAHTAAASTSGVRFDKCPYVELLSDPTATEEQRANARQWLEQHSSQQRL